MKYTLTRVYNGILWRVRKAREQRISQKLYPKFFSGIGDSEILSNILIVEYDYSNSYSPHVGGPIWPNDEIQQKYGYRRNSKVRFWYTHKTIFPKSELSSGVWVGPISDTFGHQIAEFTSRLLLCNYQYAHLDLLFSVSSSSKVTNIKNAPIYFKEILNWFKIDQARIIIIREPTLVRKLTVFRDQECLHGPGPSHEYIDLLTSWANYRLQFRSLETHKLLYVSRSKTRIPLAGERYLEKIFKTLGYEIYHPQDYPLEKQLMTYYPAHHIIFAGGSAMHTLQLLGKIEARVLVLSRIPGRKVANLALSRRCKELYYNDVVTNLLYNRRIHESSALPIINNALTKAFFAEHFVHFDFKWDENEFQQEVDKDIKNYMVDGREFIKEDSGIAVELAAQLTTLNKNHLIEFMETLT